MKRDTKTSTERDRRRRKTTTDETTNRENALLLPEASRTSSLSSSAPELLNGLELGLDELEDLSDRLPLVLEVLRYRLPQRRVSRISGGTPRDDGLTMFL